MNSNDKQKFAEMMFGLGSVYEKEISKAQVSLYFNALADYAVEQVSAGISKHVRDPEAGKWMPKPADLIAQMDGKTKADKTDLEAQAEMQWGRVMEAVKKTGRYRTPKFKDPATTAAISRMGGWLAMCDISDKSMPWKAKEFIKTYTDVIGAGKAALEVKPLAGLEDMQTGESGSGSFKTLITDLEHLKVKPKGNGQDSK